MKKILAAAMLALAIPCVAMAAKPVYSQKLLDDPGRFAIRVIDIFQLVQDTVTDRRRSKLISPDSRIILQNLVHHLVIAIIRIRQRILIYLSIKLAADNRQIPGRNRIPLHRILNKLENVYDSDGNPSTYMGKQEDPADEAEEIYMSLYRLTRGSNL